MSLNTRREAFKQEHRRTGSMVGRTFCALTAMPRFDSVAAGGDFFHKGPGHLWEGAARGAFPQLVLSPHPNPVPADCRAVSAPAPPPPSVPAKGKACPPPPPGPSLSERRTHPRSLQAAWSP